MSTTPMVAELQLGGATIVVRFVSQRRRNEIGKASQSRLGDIDLDKQSELMARETIAGWSDVTPLDALEWGYEDFESLPTDTDGTVPFSEQTAVKLYTGCILSHFRHPIDECSLSIAREVARAKKRAAASSATSPAPLG